MSDENTLDIARRMSLNWMGREQTPDEMLNEFQLFGHAKRATMLDEIDAEFNKMEVNDTNLKRFAEFSDFRRDMKGLHHKLRKANR
jgi:hypothetical protein